MMKYISHYALTIKQQIALLMISYLRDPNLVKYFMEVLSTSEVEDARKFHNSLRETPHQHQQSIIREVLSYGRYEYPRFQLRYIARVHYLLHNCRRGAAPAPSEDRHKLEQVSAWTDSCVWPGRYSLRPLPFRPPAPYVYKSKTNSNHRNTSG